MKYKGYEGAVEFDESARMFHGEVINIAHDVITFQGSSADELIQAFHDSVDDYLDLCSSRGEAAEEPTDINVLPAVGPEIRGRIILEARHQGVSVAEYLKGPLELRAHSDFRTRSV